MVKVKKESSTKARLIEVCVEMLREKPIDEISVREIAERAGVNIAAINYYFNSKESLFNEALDLAMQAEIDSWSERNLDIRDIRREDLKKILLHLHCAALQYPSLARTRIIDLLNSNKPNKANLAIYELIHKIARAIRPDLSENELIVRSTLAVSSIWYVSCGKVELEAFMNSSLECGESLERYVNRVMDILYGS